MAGGQIRAALFDAKDTDIATVPRRIVTATIAEPKEGHWKIAWVLETKHNVVFVLPDSGCPAELSTARFHQHDKIFVALGNRIFVKIDDATVRERQFGKIGE